MDTGLTFGTMMPKDGVHVTGVVDQQKTGCSPLHILTIQSGMILLGRLQTRQLSSIFSSKKHGLN